MVRKFASIDKRYLRNFIDTANFEPYNSSVEGLDPLNIYNQKNHRYWLFLDILLDIGRYE